EIARLGISDERLAESEPLLAVPIGLALAARPPESGRRRVSLLPEEVETVRSQRRQVLIASAGVAGLAVLLLFLWAGRQTSVNNAKDDADQAEKEVTRLQQQVAGLQSATALDAQLAQKSAQVTAALSDDVAWTRLLNEIATVIPNDVWLTTFTGAKG